MTPEGVRGSRVNPSCDEQDLPAAAVAPADAAPDAGEGRPGRWRARVLGLVFIAAAAAVFFAVDAAGAAVLAAPLAVVVLLLGAVSVVVLHRLEERVIAAARERAAVAARAASERAREDALRAERDRLADFLDHRPVGC